MLTRKRAKRARKEQTTHLMMKSAAACWYGHSDDGCDGSVVSSCAKERRARKIYKKRCEETVRNENERERDREERYSRFGVLKM